MGDECATCGAPIYRCGDDDERPQYDRNTRDAAYLKGHRKGAEEMRERAAGACKTHGDVCIVCGDILARVIRALPARLENKEGSDGD